MGEESSATLVENGVSPNPSMDYKKSTKPIMEKRRRARINASLLELKALLLDVMRQEGVRHQKMEKADILEMAVKHLRQIQKGIGLSTERFVLNKYNAGFNECANEVSRYLNDTDNVDIDMRTKILDHLMNVVQGGDNDDITQLPGPTLSPMAASLRSSPPSSVSPISLPSSPVKITGNFVQTVNSLATTTPVLSNGPMATVQQMQVIVKQDASPTLVQYAAPSTTAMSVIPTMNASSQVVGGLQLIPVQLANGDVVFAIPKPQVQQQPTPEPQQKQTETDESSAKEPPRMVSPPCDLTPRSPSPPPQQHLNKYHTSSSQHNCPPHQQHSPPHQQHSPPHQQNSPPQQHRSPPQQHHNRPLQHPSPLHQHHNPITQHHSTTQHHPPQLQPQNLTTVVRPSTVHQSVIKHTSPKMKSYDYNNNDHRFHSHYGDNPNLKKELDGVKTNFNAGKQDKMEFGRCQSFAEYHRKMEPLNYDMEFTHQVARRHSQKKQTSTHHGLVYKNITESRFQPYATQHHYHQDMGQQCVWRPW